MQHKNVSKAIRHFCLFRARCALEDIGANDVYTSQDEQSQPKPTQRPSMLTPLDTGKICHLPAGSFSRWETSLRAVNALLSRVRARFSAHLLRAPVVRLSKQLRLTKAAGNKHDQLHATTCYLECWANF